MRQARRLVRLVLLLGLAAPAAAQPAGRDTSLAVVAAPAPLRTVRSPVLRQEPALSPLFLASAVLPGAAQFLADDDRWVPYVAAEAWGWLRFLGHRRDEGRLERQYRDLAWEVARRISAGPRRDSAFTYYEAMAHYAASGAFDLEPDAPGIQPETQPGTFNGDIWQLARDLHFPGGSPTGPGTAAFEAAMAYYRTHAIPATYAWAWGASNLEQQAFRDLIDRSDAAARAATRYVGLILANHVVSAVDALVTARLRQLGATGLRIESVPVRHGNDLRWEYTLRYFY